MADTSRGHETVRVAGRHWRWRGLLAIGFSIFLGFVAWPALACKGDPPPPRCAKTLVLAQAAPPVLLIPGGGTFDVPVAVYFQLYSFPMGAGACPAGPYTVDVTLTVTCSPAGDGAGTVTSVPLSFGYNDLTIPVTLPAGPPRLCEVRGTAVTALSDGMVLTATNQSALCVGDPAPGNPSLPRLDLERTSGDAITKVHPGDQTGHIYRISNNDPFETFTGTLGVDMVNASRRPGMTGPQPPGTGVFAISDPGLGDNFPIGFADDLFGTCLPLPPDPTLPTIPTLNEPIVLPPGEFLDVEIFSRPWGMCADGSCGVSQVVVDGLFSNSGAALACSGHVAAADITVPPSFGWPDSGQTGLIMPPIDPLAGLLPIQGQPLPGVPIQLELLTLQPMLAIDGGLPLPIPPNFFSGPFFPELGRTQITFPQLNDQFPADSFFDIVYRVEMQPSAGSPTPFETEMLFMDLVGDAPTGFEQSGPFGMGTLGLRTPGQPDFFGFGELTYQVSGFATDETGAERPLFFEQVTMLPTPDAQGIEVLLQGGVGDGPGSRIVELTLFGDPRFYFAQRPAPGPIFGGDFNDGGLARWSRQVP